jgi:hypothetical protein
METVRGCEFVARCTRCGQPVREDHFHMMLVPVGRGRMFFHAGCKRIRPRLDLAGARLRKEGEEGTSSAQPSPKHSHHAS